ncbi:MAG TPA: UDP-N-acetylmuramate--L-alanine ligase [Patescibacteria group bacterium]|nr:UDP-N-acetylmuramate--L-alanine ligase [Patescibacteria group bacterium]
MSIKESNRIFCAGIGGIGVSGLARLFVAMGKQVAGSDLKESAITKDLESLGVKILIGQNVPDNLDADLVVYSPAVPQSELATIQISKLSHGEAIGELMHSKYGIGVTGTNGKSTSTAMLGLILEKANLDPTVLIGSNLSPKNGSDKFKANARLGQSKYFVAESDEYARKMLQNKPEMIVITNIAEDHLDVYKNLADIMAAFSQYIDSLPTEGILIYNADDKNTVELGRAAKTHKYTFGIDHYADLQAVNRKQEAGKQTFDLHLNDEMIGNIMLKLPGKFNVSNALASTLAALKLGVKFDDIKFALENFAGIWRRFEVVGALEGKPVISDYAHHPDAVSGTIAAAREFFPGKKILVVFQPHQRNRTKALFGEFVQSLIPADALILPEIFDVAGREHGENISSKDLVEELKKQKEEAEYAENLDKASELIKSKLKDFDVVLCMGAGDIDVMARKLVS